MTEPPARLGTVVGRDEVPLPPTALWIGGEWRDPVAGGTLETRDPTTGEVIANVAAATAPDVDAAVTAGKHQFERGEWSRLTAGARAALLLKLADLVERDAAILLALERREVGQPGFPPTGEIYRYYAGWADKLDGRVVPVPPRGPQRFHAFTQREPIGVVAAISPWNGPTLENARKLAPALAAGCTVVVKPPEDASLGTLHLAALVEEAGFPAGVVNVVTGFGHDAGAALVAHPDVAGVAFTGSPETGRAVMRSAVETFKHVTLELGGKSPQIFFADADLDAGVPVAVRSFTTHGGQVCAAGTRILVHRSIEAEFVERLVAGAAAVRVGDPFDPQTQMGPLVSQRHLDRVAGYVTRGVQEGAQLLVGGARPDGPGSFIEPAVFSGTNDLTVAREEIFGPVTIVIPFDDDEEAVQLANDTPYGLAAYVWTRDLARGLRVIGDLRAGAVWMNTTGMPDPRLPWGGMKGSGVGRELGPNGIEAFTEEKSVTVLL